MKNGRGFTLIELLVVISIIALLIGILLPALGAARTTARQLQSSTHVRGIHQGCVIFAQGNRGWYPGINGDGTLSEESGDPVYSGATGLMPQGRYGRLLAGNYVTAAYLISPGENAGKTLHDVNAGFIKPTNFSYAMLRLDFTLNGVDEVINKTQRVQEWRETNSTDAAVLSDRNPGQDFTVGSQVSSIWTKANSGEWRGTVTRNDNSTSFQSTPVQSTGYANAQKLPQDNIFDPDDGNADGDNAAMVFIDEVSSAGHDN